MIFQTTNKLILLEYLTQERQADIKHELIDGEVIPMSGASRKHNLISVNILASLHAQLQERDCEIYSGDMRIGINQARLYTYPDVVVVCEKPEFYDQEFDTLLNPTVIIEVLSPYTASYDRGEKFHRYRQLDSLQDYLLVSQDEIWIEHYVRQSDHTAFSAIVGYKKFRRDNRVFHPIEMGRVLIVSHNKQKDCTWILSDIQSDNLTIQLKSIDCNLNVREVYRKISFNKQVSEQPGGN